MRCFEVFAESEGFNIGEEDGFRSFAGKCYWCEKDGEGEVIGEVHVYCAKRRREVLL